MFRILRCTNQLKYRNKIVKRAFLLAVNRIIQTSPESILRDLIDFDKSCDLNENGFKLYAKYKWFDKN